MKSAPGYREKSADLQGILKVFLTPHRTCMYVLVTEKNQLICKGHLRYTCDFITEYQGHTDPTMKTGMHIFSACMHYDYKHIYVSRVTYERLVHMHSPCQCCKISHSLAGFARVILYTHMYLASILTHCGACS